MKSSSISQIALTVFNPLPAVVIGGPPHSGKSVLAYSLTHVLRERAVPHYLLRAYPPDYEGDWFHQGEREWVRRLRLKGARSDAWLPPLRRDIARRHLPLIVDMGGLPTPDQETTLDDCTHAILLTPHDEAREAWAARMARHGLVLLADLRSDLHGQNRLTLRKPVLEGTLSKLERGRLAEGPSFAALADRLADLFAVSADELCRHHLENAPVELTVDVARAARQMGLDPHHWRPQDLPAVLDYLPAGEQLALYGRGPNWLYAAIAAHCAPAPFFLFDVRLGWVKAPKIPRGAPPPEGPLTVRRRPFPDAPGGAQRMDFRLLDAYLDIDDVDALRLPRCPATGVVLGGKLPLWIWAGLARACETDWVAVMHPQLQGAVVVKSDVREPAVGTVLIG
jgi:CRISPR-associated protein Csx3